MLTKKDLRELRASRYRIRCLQERIEVLRSQMENTVFQRDNTPVQSSPLRDLLERQIAQLDEWERELETDRCELLSGQRYAEKQFELLPDGQREVMIARYVDGLPWMAVASRVGYGIDNCFVLHRKAVRAIGECRRGV